MNPVQLPNNTTYQEVLRWASSFLESEGKESHLAEWLLRERLGWNKTDLMMHFKKEMPKDEKNQFEEDFKRLCNGEPVQYIIGHEWFFDRAFQVTSDTLIPRPETEEWFYKYIHQLPEKKLKVVDIGTGSGILAISHKLKRPQDEVVATDISAKALKIAKENANLLDAEIDMRLGDLTDPLQGEDFDIVISNPPYISEDEQNVMDDSVINYEPHIALFAEENGLTIYKKLAKELPKHVKKETEIFMEIGYKQGAIVQHIFQEAFPEAIVEIWKDFSQNDRVIHIKR